MKTDRIPDIYLEQYILGELPEPLRREINDLIQKDPELNERINRILESDRGILSAYPAETMARKIMERKNQTWRTSLKTAAVKKGRTEPGFFTAAAYKIKSFIEQIFTTRARRYAFTLSSAFALLLLVIFLFPGIRSGFDTGRDIEKDVRIKGLDSKLLLYRIKNGKAEELKNDDTVHRGDIIQAGYIATGDYKYGLILSIDGRGTVTLHYPSNTSSGQKLSLNRKTLLSRSYELDDSPHFERFIMILSTKSLNNAEIIEKSKKLAKNRESAINGSLKNEKDEAEFSIFLKKAE